MLPRMSISAVTIRSKSVPALAAVNTPDEKPSTYAIRAAEPASSAVFTNLGKMISDTGLLCTQDVPKSPCNTAASHLPY